MSFGNLFLWRVTLGVLFALFAVYLPYAGLSPGESAATTLTFRLILAGLTLLCVVAFVAGPIWKRSDMSSNPSAAPPTGAMSEAELDSLIRRYVTPPSEERRAQPTAAGHVPLKASTRVPDVERRSGFGRRLTDR